MRRAQQEEGKGGEQNEGNDETLSVKVESKSSGSESKQDVHYNDSTSKKRKASHACNNLNEDRMELRRAANRRSATQSRIRRQQETHDLRATVKALVHETEALRESNRTMQLQLESALAENRQLRFNNMLMQQQQQVGGLANTAANRGSAGTRFTGFRGTSAGLDTNPLRMAQPSAPLAAPPSLLQLRYPSLASSLGIGGHADVGMMLPAPWLAPDAGLSPVVDNNFHKANPIRRTTRKRKKQH